MIRLSIIVPFFNVEKYIEQCIRSLYEQDIPCTEYEVICVDDCSTDNSFFVIQKLQKEFKTLRLIHLQQNIKQGGARNVGLKCAHGEYVWFVDSDDYILSSILGTLLHALYSEQLTALHFDYLIDIGGIQKLGAKHLSTGCYKGNDLFFLPSFVWWQDFISPWQTIVRREFLLRHFLYFQEGVQYEDTDYSIKLYALLDKVRHIDLQPYVYRMNNNSITRRKYGFEHIKYWVLLSIRLHKIKQHFYDSGYDLRFQSTIISLINDSLSRSVDVYKELTATEQCEILRLLKKERAFFLLRYLSIKQSLKIVWNTITIRTTTLN